MPQTPIDLANTIYKISSFVALLALALSAIAGIFIYISSEIRGKYSDQLIENARALGAQANESAAVADVKAEQLKKDNLELSITLERERRERIELERRLGPRLLSIEQKKAIHETLKNISKRASVIIITSDNSPEASNYASEIYEALRASGVKTLRRNLKVTTIGSPDYGVSLILLGGPEKQAIKRAFTSTNIVTEVRQDNEPSEEDKERMLYNWSYSAAIEVKAKPPHL